MSLSVKYGRKSRHPIREKHLKRLNLLLLVILIPALSVLTACQTQRAVLDTSYEQALVSMIPQLPEIPSWSKVNWRYQNGMYCLSESDADLVLDYIENDVSQYRFEMSQYEQQFQIALDALCHKT